MAAVASPVASLPAKAGYAPFTSAVLHHLMTTGVDLFIWNGKVDRAVLFHEGGTPLTEAQARHLQAKCGDCLYVRSGDYEHVCGELLSSLDTVVGDETIQPTERFSLLQTALSFEVGKSLKAIDAGEFVSLVDRVGTQINTLVGEQRIPPADLYAIARHDSQTFSHVTNVAGYATVLAERLGIADVEQLNQITIGAMLHDIGKRFIPSEILTKPGRLTDEERLVIQTHPQRGYEDLLDHDDLNHEQLMMVYQHHEHVDGNGYPVKILGDEIHPWARLLAVVDVFDALTGKRPYRKPMPMAEALQFIADRAGTQFDEEMARCWVDAVKTN